MNLTIHVLVLDPHSTNQEFLYIYYICPNICPSFTWQYMHVILLSYYFCTLFASLDCFHHADILFAAAMVSVWF